MKFYKNYISNYLLPLSVPVAAIYLFIYKNYYNYVKEKLCSICLEFKALDNFINIKGQLLL